MFYRITIEKIDLDRNTFSKSQVEVTEEMCKMANFDILEHSAVNAVKRFRHDFETFKTKEQ